MVSATGFQPTLLVVGAGGLGRAIISDLCRTELPLRIFATSRDASSLEPFLNLVRLCSATSGFAPWLQAVDLDLDAPEACAETIERIQPDLVLMTGTRQTWWLPQLLPPEPRQALEKAGYGPWLPVHFDLTYRLMKILSDLGLASSVIAACYPDVVNPLLAGLGLSPWCGIGNIDEIVSRLKVQVARAFQAPLQHVDIEMVAHHALQVAISRLELATHRPGISREPASRHVFDSGGAIPPFALRIQVRKEGVLDASIASRFLLKSMPLPSGPATHALTAACATRLIRAALAGTGQILHIPGPNGLPGGYPVRLADDLPNRRKLEVNRFGDLSLEEMIEINRRSHAFDGIESIREDGTVVFTTPAQETMSKVLGYDCAEFRPEEATGRANELIERFRRLAEGHGIALNNPRSQQE